MILKGDFSEFETEGVIKCKFSKSVFLSSYSQKTYLRHHGRSKSGQSHQRSSRAIFQKVYFWAPRHRRSILGIIGGQNQVKVTKGQQVQIFKKFIFELLCIEKVLWASGEVKIRSRSPNIIKCKFSKSLFFLVCFPINEKIV